MPLGIADANVAVHPKMLLSPVQGGPPGLVRAHPVGAFGYAPKLQQCGGVMVRDTCPLPEYRLKYLR